MENVFHAQIVVTTFGRTLCLEVLQHMLEKNYIRPSKPFAQAILRKSSFV